MQEKFQFRNVFNPEMIIEFAARLKRTWPEFQDKEFCRSINSKLIELQYGERSALITDKIKEFLPDDYPTAVTILLKSLGPPLDQKDLNGYNGFIIMPQTRFVSKYGMYHYELSMKALYEMTKRFTAEGDLGYFIEKYPIKTMEILQKWAKDENCHVRRLVSEGSRPRLPLGRRLAMFQQNPFPVIELLDTLKTDSELYVRRSVANNLNDIAKDNPQIVIDTLERWKNVKNPGTQWIIKHALRTLLKQGHPEALALLGYTLDPQLRVNSLELSTNTVKIDSKLTFRFNIDTECAAAQNLMIDYIIHYVKANGKTAPKVFKLAKKKLRPREEISLSQSHLFKQMTTRKHYPGIHKLEIVVNGKRFTKAEFTLDI